MPSSLQSSTAPCGPRGWTADDGPADPDQLGNPIAFTASVFSGFEFAAGLKIQRSDREAGFSAH